MVQLIHSIKLIITDLDMLVRITGPVYLYWKVQRIFHLSGGWTVGRSYKYPPKEGNMMSDFCPPLKPEQTSTRASERGRGWGWGVCTWWSCRRWVKRVSNSNLHLCLEQLPLRCQSAVQSCLPLPWKQSRPSCCAGPGWWRHQRGDGELHKRGGPSSAERLASSEKWQ